MAISQEGEFSEGQWDKKKIIVAALVLAGVVVGGYKLRTSFLNKNISQANTNGQSTKILGTESGPVSNTKGDSHSNSSEQIDTAKRENQSSSQFPTIPNVSQTINSIKQEISHLNPVEVSATSPQVQKVLQDIKSLQDYPKSQAKETCLKICSGL